MRSHVIGLRLCGIAEEPFWPRANGSAASRTSLRCRWRISVAKRSSELPRIASDASSSAWRSRATTCVATSSRPRPSSRQSELLDARVDVAVRADGARQLADGDAGEGALDALAAAAQVVPPAEQLEPERRRLGVHAVGAAHARRGAVLAAPARAPRRARGRGRRAPRRRPRAAAARAPCRRRPRRSARSGTSAPRRRPARRSASVKAITSWWVRRSISLARSTSAASTRARSRTATTALSGTTPSSLPGRERGELDLEPAAEAPLVAPDGCKPRERVAGDHLDSIRGASAAPSSLATSASASTSASVERWWVRQGRSAKMPRIVVPDVSTRPSRCMASSSARLCASSAAGVVEPRRMVPVDDDRELRLVEQLEVGRRAHGLGQQPREPHVVLDRRDERVGAVGQERHPGPEAAERVRHLDALEDRPDRPGVGPVADVLEVLRLVGEGIGRARRRRAAARSRPPWAGRATCAGRSQPSRRARGRGRARPCSARRPRERRRRRRCGTTRRARRRCRRARRAGRPRPCSSCRPRPPRRRGSRRLRDRSRWRGPARRHAPGTPRRCGSGAAPAGPGRARRRRARSSCAPARTRTRRRSPGATPCSRAPGRARARAQARPVRLACVPPLVKWPMPAGKPISSASQRQATSSTSEAAPAPPPRLASSAAASTAAATPASSPEPSMNGNERGCECASERGSTSFGDALDRGLEPDAACAATARW